MYKRLLTLRTYIIKKDSVGFFVPTEERKLSLIQFTAIVRPFVPFGPMLPSERMRLYLHRSASLGFSRHFLWQPAHAADSVSAASTILSWFLD